MKNLLFVALLTIGNAFQIHAQQQVNGIITDKQSGEPLPTATVMINGTVSGTTTDNSGRFSITAKSQDTLSINYVGYSEKQIVVGDQSELSIALDSDYELESLIIRGVRALENEPVAKTTISHKEIEKEYVGQHPIFILDRLSPGIYSYSEAGTSVGNYGSIRLRGVGQERINFTLNGVPLNDMVDHGVFFSNFSDISNNFESIQVQRGVGTSTTGVSSYGGSINFESLNLKKNPAGSSVELAAGSFNTFRANYNVNTGISEKGFGFYSSFGRLWSDGYKDFTETDAYSFFFTGGYYGDKDMVRITAFNSRSHNGLGYYVVDEPTLIENPTFNPLTEDDNDDFSQYLVQIQHSHDFDGQWKLSSSAYYGGAGGDFAEGTPDEDSVFVENFGTSFNTRFFQINYPLKNDHYGLLSNIFYNAERFNFSSGLHAYTFLRENREAILPQNSNPYYSDNTQKNELSWFAKADYRFGNLQIFGDLQFRTMELQFDPDYNFIGAADEGTISKSWTFLNPKLGMNYSINSEQEFYFSYGFNGREPTRVDLLGGFQLNGGNINIVRAESEFEPEFVHDFEAGYKLNLQKLSLEGNLFYMNFRNEIAAIGEIVAFGVQKRENIPSSVRAGLEVSWFWSASDLIDFHGNLAYLNASIDEFTIFGDATYSDRTHILSPEWLTNTSFTIHPTSTLGLTLTHHLMTEQYMELTNDPEFVVPGWQTFDLNIQWELSQNVDLSLMVNNLLDRQYYSYGAPDFSGNPAFLIQPPRNFYLATRIRL